LFIILMSMNSLSNAEKISPGCADDLDQTALKTVREAMPDYWVREKARDAARRIEQALALEPRLHFGYDILKIYYCFHQKKCDQAVILLKKAIQHCPDYYGHHYGLAEVYVKMGKHAEALASYKNALDKGEQETAYFYFKVAESHVALKQRDEAISNLRKSLELDERYFIARRNLIGLLYLSQNKQEALSEARILISLKPDAKMMQWAKTVIRKMSQ